MIASSRSSGESNFGLPRTPLVGRDRELRSLRAVLLRPEIALLTLTGPAGIGKTRLAQHVAADLRDAFADGVAFVSLAPLRDPNLVPAGIAEALGLPDGDELAPRTPLRSYLRQKEMMLVLDNVEHLLAAAPFIADLLSWCPALKILATSRAPLRLSEEHDFPVPPMAFPDESSLPLVDLARFDAISLFVQRAAAVNPAFTLAETNAADVIEICTRLDGIPLAIELAAARTRLLTPATIRARLANRLLLLTDGPRDRPPRLRSMRDAIAWSYDLLTAEEQIHFRRLAVFTGELAPDTVAHLVSMLNGNEPDSAVWHADDTLSSPAPALFHLGSSLVENNLVQPIGDAADQPRFRLLETVREFGLERLAAAGEETATRAVHARTFLALAEFAEPQLRGPDQAMWFDRLEREHPNVRAALDWLQSRGDTSAALRLAGALGRFWEARGHLTEGRSRLGALLRSAGQTPGASIPERVKAKAELWAGTLAYWQGDYDEANRLHTAALQRFEEVGDDWGAALTLMHHGQPATYAGDLERARALISASLRRFEAIGDAWGVAAARTGLVNPMLEMGDLDAVAQLLAEGLPQVRAVGDPDLLAMTLINVGWLASRRGEDRRAEAALEESLAIFRRIGERRTMPFTLNLLGQIAWRRGEPSLAAVRFHEGLTASRDLGSRLAIVNSFTALAMVAAATEQYDRAAGLLGAAYAVRESIGAPVQPVEQPAIDAVAARGRAAIGEAAYASEFAIGATRSLDAAIAGGLAFVTELASLTPPATRPTPAAKAVLSPRELDVLRLLVEGHSNPEIAAALFISHKTVRNHVTHILAKLGVESRTAAATFALRRGLV